MEEVSGVNTDKVIETLRLLIDKEQELYRLYIQLAEETDDNELKEVLGYLAYEEFIHLNTILDRYKALVDEKDKG